MPDVHPYARELAQKVGASSKRQVSIKARTLLKGFDYFRRTPAIIQEIDRQLELCNLKCDFNMVYPHSLDERVSIRLAAVSPELNLETISAAMQHYGLSSTDPITSAVSATVEIFTDIGTGSGFIVHPDGLVITGRHVVNNEEGVSLRRVKVCLYSQQKNELTVEGTIFRSHPRLDFALLWLDGPGPFPTLPLGNPQQARHTQTVYAIGAPAGLPNTVSRGIISNPLARFNMLECLQSDAAIDRGNSGGPLVTEAGQAIGINLWGLGDFDAAKFSIPVDYLKEDLKTAIAAGREACLKAVYCTVCGFADFNEPTWFCRNCGVQWKLEEKGK
jgi:S1-C subfamily serine protease